MMTPKVSLQDRLEAREGCSRRRFFAALRRAIDRDIRHRARPVEGDKRDDVLEAVGPHVGHGLAHAGAFKLEDTDRFAALQHGVGLSYRPDGIFTSSIAIPRFFKSLMQ